MSDAGELVNRWRDSMGEWSDDDPAVLAWPWKPNEPVVADVDGQLRLYHSGLVYPNPIDDAELAGVLESLGEPSVLPLSSQSHRFDKDMFEWER